MYDRSPKPVSSDKGSPAAATTPKAETNGRKSDTHIAVPFVAEESRARRLRELRLQHCFIVDICPTFPGAHVPHIHRTWVFDVPQLAVHYEPLMNGIMALSILYLSLNNIPGPLPMDQLKVHRAHYVEATLQEHRKAIGIMDRDIADAASFTSVLLSLDAFASLRERPSHPYEPPIQWLYMCKGVMNVFRVAMDLVRDDPTARINIVSDRSASIVEPSVIFRESNRARFPYLMEMLGDETNEDQEAYASTVSFLGAIITAKEAGDDASMIARRVLVFPIMFPTRFVELLSENKPRALIILGHFFAIASFCCHSWWVGNTPEKEVQAISDHLGPQWQRFMSWPMEQVKTSSKSQFPTPS